MARTILCYGDSNTYGTPPMADLDDWGRFDRDSRWPGVMAGHLGPGWNVIEEGHPGRTTVHDDPVEGPHRNGLTILPAILESHRPIDLVILKLGTNDLKPRFSATAADIALSLGRLILTIRAFGVGPDGQAPQVLLAAPPPVEEAGCLAAMFEGAAAKSRALGPAIEAEARRKAVALVKAGDVIAVSPRDGIHYEAEAHRRLGQVMAEAVQHHFREG